jgi:hypothetical protein
LPTKLSASLGRTEQNDLPVVFLLDGNKIVLKAYPSPDGTKLRIVLPEMQSMKAARIDVDSHYIEVIRGI